MGIYSEVAYGTKLNDYICNHYSITDKNLGKDSSFETFSFFIRNYIMWDRINLISVDPDGGGITDIYYAIYKNNNHIDSIVEKYKEAISNLDNEFNMMIFNMDELIEEDPDMKEEFCYMIFDSPNYQEAKKKLMELKDIIRSSFPDVISIQSHG